MPLCRPIQTRFRYGSGCNSLNLATKSNSPDHSPKGTPSGLCARRSHIALRLLVGIRFQVLFHSAHRRSFHLSLMVLVHYRSPRVFSLGEWAPQLPTGLACPVVLKVTAWRFHPFAYGTFTPYGRPFQCRSTRDSTAVAPALQPPFGQAKQVWAVPLSLATTRGIISFPEVT